MSYVDGFVAAVPNENKEKFIAHASMMAAVLKQHGALRVVDTWADDVPDGKLTSFPMAVQKQQNESVAFSWIEWPSKQVRDAAWAAIMQDPNLDNATNPMPFDGQRMIYGGFAVLSDL